MLFDRSLGKDSLLDLIYCEIMKRKKMHPFEKVLSVVVEDIEFTLRGHQPAPWADFLLNPRRLRGSDFLMRWSQGYWSEERLIEAVNETGKYYAIPYGPSGVAPKEVRDFELYFERLEHAGLGQLKRPDVLLFRASKSSAVAEAIREVGGITELPFTHESHPGMQRLLHLCLIAIECENSLWIAQQMPHYNAKLRPQKRLGNQLGLPKNSVLPTVIIKDEDLPFLRGWQNSTSVPIHIWHAFFDLAFGISLDEAIRLIDEQLILPKEQTFQAPAGATTKKATYNIYHHYAYPLAVTEGEVELKADKITDANGHILPYVRFYGGQLRLLPEALKILDEIAAGDPS
ncbi:MAG: AccI family restriction endonuclease [Abitibacteriaceae bacterium]|nr:AccI family restriction endonuclease [Abditibacteriaceae bacterium]MBV9865089.1 AccI family restriction endonuclease [Abditibacteriaceae bacterium]